MNEKIKKIAKEVTEEIAKLKLKSKKEIEAFVKDRLRGFNQKVQEEITKEMKKRGVLSVADSKVNISSLLYENAKHLSKQITSILQKANIKKQTCKAIAKEIYEGYGFRDEFMKSKTAFPKYLVKAIESGEYDKAIRQIEKIKTRSLKFTYERLMKELESINRKALQKYMNNVYYEKIRYYATRIADTETQRMAMQKDAYEYLNDKEIEFVRYRLSSSHPKTDICDFYANLDIGYGRGVVKKEDMRTLPLHPFCHCYYEPHHGDIKGKRKPWKEAVSDTMRGFSDYQQKEILATKAMLNRFKSGEDIEKIFNTLRPKYPIKRYVDEFGYNSGMKKYNDNLNDFIKDIEDKSIKNNEIIVGFIADDVYNFLNRKSIMLEKRNIIFTVKSYNHSLRDFKKSINKSVDISIIKKIDKYLNNPKYIFYDSLNKHKNLMYIGEYDNQLFKIIINLKTYIVTLGKINKNDLKDKFLERIR